MDVDIHPQERLGAILKPLGSLSELSLHLDHTTTPHLIVAMRTAVLALSRDAITAFSQTIHKIANVLAQSLGSSVKLVKFLQPWDTDSHRWSVFRIVHDPDGSPPHAEYDMFLTVCSL